MHTPNDPRPGDSLTRRHLLGGLAAVGAGAALAALPTPAAAAVVQQPAKLRGNVNHSVCFWCFNTAGEKWDLNTTCRHAAQLGCRSVEIVPPEQWKILEKHKLICAIAPNGMDGMPFVRGYNNPKYHQELNARLRKVIDACADAKFPNVIAFTGYKWRNAENPKSGEIPRGEAADNCVKGLQAVVGHAEKRGVTICVEHLNTRDSSHPMKGHPGYSGDDLDWVAAIIRRVGSARLRLLFDVYHVQVMHGDLLRRLEQNRDILGHIHTAGNPGRGELDERQEINYPAVMRKLLDLKYRGHVGHEFIPTRAPLAGLRQAVQVCDV